MFLDRWFNNIASKNVLNRLISPAVITSSGSVQLFMLVHLGTGLCNRDACRYDEVLRGEMSLHVVLRCP
eukprot:10617051-Heterocapsa_arctica.AAC.1